MYYFYCMAERSTLRLCMNPVLEITEITEFADGAEHFTPPDEFIKW